MEILFYAFGAVVLLGVAKVVLFPCAAPEDKIFDRLLFKNDTNPNGH